MIKDKIWAYFSRVKGNANKVDKNLIEHISNEIRYDTRRFLLQEHILHDNEPGVSNERYNDSDIIVSLTTHGKRINDVAYTIESIMQQSFRANRIVLWLGNEEKEKQLPRALKLQEKRGLEIHYCEDIRAYTKLIPSLKRFPEAAIITIDDDLLYEFDLIERLVTAYNSQPHYIHACRLHRIGLDSNNKLIPYNNWEWNINEIGPNKYNFITGVGGVLYPPHCFDDEIFNQNVFMKLSRFADDIWYTAMAIKNNTKVSKIPTRKSNGRDYLINESVQDTGLINVNTRGECLNDIQIEAVFSEYSIIEKLKNDII